MNYSLTEWAETITIFWTVLTAPGQIHGTWCAIRDWRANGKGAAPEADPE